MGFRVSEGFCWGVGFGGNLTRAFLRFCSSVLRVFWWLLGAFTAWWVERAYSLGFIGLKGSILYKGSTKFERQLERF